MKLRINHTTAYSYQEPVKHSIQCIRLSPYASMQNTILNWQLECPGSVTEHIDSFGNRVHIVTVDSPHQEVSFHVHGEVEINANNEETSPGEHALANHFYLRATDLTSVNDELYTYSRDILGEKPELKDMNNLMRNVLHDMPYWPGATNVSDTAVEAFAKRAGVCQDHTHVFLTCCRTAGLPARYVSGYIHSNDTNHVATHAWAEVWQNNSWHSFDITNQLTNLQHHLKLAIGLDYLDACPVRGVRFGGGGELMETKALVYQKKNDQ